VAVVIVVAGMWELAGVAEILAAEAGSPTVAVRGLLEALEEYKDGDAARLTPAEQARNARIIQIARERLSVRVVAERAFGKRWETLTEAQRNEFMGLFSTLLEEKAYPKSGSFFADLTVKFLGETVTGDRATVNTEVVHPKEGEITIDYWLERKDGRWVIVDVILDGASLAFDIRSQVTQILVKDSFPALIQRMKDRLTEG
jgi:phospholipid transport system substrate-binding protein